MTTATISSKGQITIPADVRHALQVDTGDRVEFVEIEPDRYEFVVRIPVNVTADSGNVTGIPAKVTEGRCCAF